MRWPLIAPKIEIVECLVISVHIHVFWLVFDRRYFCCCNTCLGGQVICIGSVFVRFHITEANCVAKEVAKGIEGGRFLAFVSRAVFTTSSPQMGEKEHLCYFTAEDTKQTVLQSVDLPSRCNR